MACPYALTRAPQGAMRVDRRSRVHRIPDRDIVVRAVSSTVFLGRGQGPSGGTYFFGA